MITQTSIKDRKKAIRTGDPITLYGLTFYPVTMSQYEIFLACKSVWKIRMSSLPVRYISMDFLSALWAIKADETLPEAKTLFDRAIMLFSLSLRIGENESETSDFKIVFRNSGKEIDFIEVTHKDKPIRITPIQFSTEIRSVIANQNGIELPREDWNNELVEAEREKNKLKNGNVVLKESITDLIASVAYLSHTREKDIYNWTVREFENRREAIDRDKHYMLCSFAEIGGMVKFKNGNPAPSWCFDLLDESLGTQSLSEIGKIFNGSGSTSNEKT